VAINEVARGATVDSADGRRAARVKHARLEAAVAVLSKLRVGAAPQLLVSRGAFAVW